MLSKGLPQYLRLKAQDTLFFRDIRKFCIPAALTLAVALALCAYASVSKERDAANADIANYYLPDLPELAPASEIWRQEPPFKQKELAAFVRDLHSIQTMNERDTVNYLLRDRGWTRERLRYLDRKTALMITAINSGGLESLSQKGPYFLPPTREEIAAVQRYYPVLNNMLKNNMLKTRESAEE